MRGHDTMSSHPWSLAAPPESISIQSVGGLAIRPGGLLTVTEDIVSQVSTFPPTLPFFADDYTLHFGDSYYSYALHFGDSYYS